MLRILGILRFGGDLISRMLNLLPMVLFWREKMDKKVKSLSAYVGEVVDKFAYQDFQPPINQETLKDKLQQIFSLDTPYWKPIPLPPKWQKNWFALEIKSFKDFDRINIGFSVLPQTIRLVAFYNIYGDSQFSSPFYQADIGIDEIWIDHGLFISFLTNKILNCIQLSNGKSVDKKLEW